MAVYETSFFYAGVYSGGQFTPFLFAESTFTFDSEDDTFISGEIITVDGQPVGRYIGFAGDGIVVQDVSENGLDRYYYYSNTLLQNDNSFPVNSSTPFFYCFLAGTGIATPAGTVAVEDLVVGSPVLTADGRTVPVKWLGWQTVITAFGPDLARRPVRLLAGALGPDRPARDLCVTADHALLLDGVLVQAGALVNGTTVRRMTNEDLGDRYTVFHIETEAHNLILAEGVPAETFVDNVSRRRFDNYAEFEALYGDSAPAVAEMDGPRVKSTRQLPRSIRRLIDDRAATLSRAVAAAA